MLSNVSCSLTTFGNIPKVIQMQPWMKIKWKIDRDHGVQCLYFQKKKKKKWYQVKEDSSCARC